MSHIWMSHVTHMNESCHTYEWVMSHIWMSHVTMSHALRTSHVKHMYVSWHTFKWVMSRPRTSRVSEISNVNELCHTYGWVMSMKKSCQWVMSHKWMNHTSAPQRRICTPEPQHMHSRTTYSLSWTTHTLSRSTYILSRTTYTLSRTTNILPPTTFNLSRSRSWAAEARRGRTQMVACSLAIQ